MAAAPVLVCEPGSISIKQAEDKIYAPGSPCELADFFCEGRKQTLFKNALPNIRAHYENTIANFGNNPYLTMYTPEGNVEAGEWNRMTYNTMHRNHIVPLSHALRRMGLQKGDRIAVAMRNWPEYLIILWTCFANGYVLVPVNAHLVPAEMAFVVGDCGAAAVFADPGNAEKILQERRSLGDLKHIIYTRSAGRPPLPGTVTYEEVVGSERGKHGDKLPEVSLTWEDNASLMYSSGTTGKPKGVLHGHKSWCMSPVNGQALGLRTFMRAGMINELPPADAPAPPTGTFLVAAPFFHINGTGLAYGQTLAGAHAVIMYKWDAAIALKIIEEQKITYFGGVPTMAWQMVTHPDLAKRDVSSLASLYSGGSHSSPELFQGIKDKMKATGAQNGYGATENFLASCNTGYDYERKPGSVGVPCRHITIKITNDDGTKILPPNVPGEIWVRSPTLMKEYWRNPKATTESMVDGFYKAGDIGYLDDEGYLYITDRSKDMVIRGGENIYTIEVENALYKHPAIMEACVFGVKEKVLGEEVAAVVRVKPNFTGKLTETELIEHCRKLLAPFKVPIQIDVRYEELPLTESGKVLKRQLKAEAEKARELKGKL
ncbi:hypothetical protein DFJ74DRAFT_673686 [Hyaloraphidium curvatum]|nr:hypothetical protein DFJ74DRAFT_673686 [Hyaloraphidium curvatum]